MDVQRFTVDEENDDEDDQLLEYIFEISILSTPDMTERLQKECQQILSKQNIRSSAYDQLNLDQRASISLYCLYHQHLADEAKQLYNEASIRALQQEYESINNEKVEYDEKFSAMEEQYHQRLKINEKQLFDLQQTNEELSEQSELERLGNKQSMDNLVEQCHARIQQMEYSLYQAHEENQQLQFQFNQLQEHYQALSGNDYDQLNTEYEQLKHDYDELINENELLKDINSKMYQEQLQKTAYGNLS